jgi:hypothetical protein
MPLEAGKHPAELLTRVLIEPNVFASSREYRAARAAAWAALIEGGLTITDIGVAVGLSRERVRQILRAEGYLQRRGSRGPGSGADPVAIVKAVRNPHSYGPGSLARLAKCSASTASMTLKELGLWPATQRLFRLRLRRFSSLGAERARASIIEALQAFERETGQVPSIPDAMRGDLPFAHTTAVRYFGSWSNAIRAAGMTPRSRGGAGHRR